MKDIKELNAKLARIMKHFGVDKKTELSEDEILRKKYADMQRQKLIDSLKSGCRTDGIKSAGNGL